jgi:DNA-binding LytR/AlgR family response regulator
MFSDVQYVEADKRYVKFVTAERYYLTEGSICNVELLLPADQFCRIHRSYIISLKHTRRFNAVTVTVGDTQLPIGKEYRDRLKKKVILACSDMLVPKEKPALG